MREKNCATYELATNKQKKGLVKVVSTCCETWSGVEFGVIFGVDFIYDLTSLIHLLFMWDASSGHWVVKQDVNRCLVFSKNASFTITS